MVTQRRPGGVEPILHLKETYKRNFVDGMVATDGVVYSAVVTLGTGATNVLNLLIDPGFAMSLDQLEVGFTQRFTELGLGTGSINYMWQIRSEGNFLGSTAKPVATTMAYAAVWASLSKGVASAQSAEDTFSGYINVGSVPRAPFRINLQATAALLNNQMYGRVKNSSYVKFIGTVIPGA